MFKFKSLFCDPLDCRCYKITPIMPLYKLRPLRGLTELQGSLKQLGHYPQVAVRPRLLKKSYLGWD